MLFKNLVLSVLLLTASFAVPAAQDSTGSEIGQAAPVESQKATPKGFVSQGGLTWMPVSFKKNWSDANDYCNNTAINGQSGWRLPTIIELRKLDQSGLMKGQGWVYGNTWSSTSENSGTHYYEILTVWATMQIIDTTIMYVTCVRPEVGQAAAAERQKLEAPKGFVSQGGLTWMPLSFKKNWSNANDYCNNTAINGQSGWRLPTVVELQSLYDSRSLLFRGLILEEAWSSDLYYDPIPRVGGKQYRTVHLTIGWASYFFHSSIMYVTCVRPDVGQAAAVERQKLEAPKRFVSQGGLTWMPISLYMNWHEAKAYCNNTAINGQSNWRLPTEDELEALYESRSMENQGWTLSSTWSSTPDDIGNHFRVGLDYGGSHWDGDNIEAYVTCVR